MMRDISKLKANTNKLVTKHEWIIQTLRTMNNQDPKNIGLSERQFKILANSLSINPNIELTPYQHIFDKYQL